MPTVIEGREFEWPPYVAWIQSGLMTLIIISVAIDSAIPHRGVVVGLTAVAASGCFFDALDRRLPPLIRIPMVFIPLGIINLGAVRFGFDSAHGDFQITLMVLVFFVGEAAALYTPKLAVGVVAAATVLAAWAGTIWSEHGGTFIWIIAMLLGGVVGMFMRALMSAIVQRDIAQEELSEKAATEERHRIAREVHDVIAHSLTVTMLHVTAARLAVNRGDSAGATEALEEAERSGRQSLAEVRRTVGLLRDDERSATALEPPAPQATDIEALVESFRATGQQVEVLVAGDLASIPDQAGLALYRIVQESLTNVGRHTPGAKAAVRVTAGPTTTVSIRSAGGTRVDAPGSGTGVDGMRERAEALGGRLTARADGSGWLVEAVLPGKPLDATATVVAH